MHHVYNKTTGLFTGSAVHTDNKAVDIQELVRVNFGDGFAGIAGVQDRLSQKIDVATGRLVDYQPPPPTPEHEWNAVTKRWQPNAKAQAANAHEAARVAARARVAEEERDLVRRLTLEPLEADRTRLREIDAELRALDASRNDAVR
jgi:hypothetical protein